MSSIVLFQWFPNYRYILKIYYDFENRLLHLVDIDDLGHLHFRPDIEKKQDFINSCTK